MGKGRALQGRGRLVGWADKLAGPAWRPPWRTMASEPIHLSVILPTRDASLGAEAVTALTALGVRWEALADPVPEAGRGQAWRKARGEWLLFPAEGWPLPDLAPLAAPVGDCVLAQAGLEAGQPFAIRRSLLLELGGLADLPAGLAGFELGLRLRAGGVRCLRTPLWAEASPAVPAPTYDDALALFLRHPLAEVLGWLCDRLEGVPADPAEAQEARFLRVFGHPVPAQCRHSIAELAEYYAEGAEPPYLPVGEIEGLLAGAVAAGLHHAGPALDPRLDLHHAGNWLVAETRYFEALESRNLVLRHPPPRLAAGAGAASLGVTLEGRYEVDLDTGALAGLYHPIFTLDLPAACREQPEVELFDFEPAGLEAFLDPTRSLLHLPLAEAPPGGLRIGYSVRCRVEEGAGHGHEGPEPRPEPNRVSPHYAARLDAILAAILQGRPEAFEPRARARRIYDWILDHVTFLGSDRMGLLAIDARAGNCSHRARLFCLLCQRAGLAARTRAGVLAIEWAGSGVQDGSPWADTAGACRGQALNHVWTEVHVPGEGWLPVDFLGTDSGSRMMTSANVPSAAVRARVLELTPGLEDYYFGNLDPYRLHFGVGRKAVAGIPFGLGEGLDAIWRAAWGCRHRFRCRISGLPEPGAWPAGPFQILNDGVLCGS